MYHNDNTLIYNHMRLSPVFIYEDDTLLNAIDAMKKFKMERISIIKKDFSIVGYIDSDKVRDIIKTKFHNNISLVKNTKIKEIIDKHNFPIVFYPGMKITNAYNAMKYLNVKCLPVVDTPWEKKIIGFLWLEDILPYVEKTYLKIPV